MNPAERILNEELLREARAAGFEQLQPHVPEPPRSQPSGRTHSRQHIAPAASVGGDIDTIFKLIHDKAEQRSKKIRVVFRNFDANKSGALSVEEFRQGLAFIGVVLSNQDFRRLLAAVDSDGSGTIDYNEFVSKMKSNDAQMGDIFNSEVAYKAQMAGYQRRTAAVERANKQGRGQTSARTNNGKGRSTANILDTVRVKCEAKSKQIRKVFREFDSDKSGTLSHVEFRRGMHNMGIVLTDDEFLALLSVIGRNGDGTVDYNEFVAKMKFPENPDLQEADQRVASRAQGSQRGQRGGARAGAHRVINM